MHKKRKKDCKNDLECISSWIALSDKQKNDIFSYSEGHKNFFDKSETELSFVSEAVKITKKVGFKTLTEQSPIVPELKYYDVNRDSVL